MKWFWSKAKKAALNRPMTSEELRLTVLADAETRGVSLLDTSIGDNMPLTTGSVTITKASGLGLKPIAVDGSYLSRTIDDINARAAENDIRAKRSR